jgi:hypothetical protein
MYTQKDFAKVLDRAARRASNPASSKQTWFLAGLYVKNNDTEQLEREYNDLLLDYTYALSVREASSMIDFFLNTQKAA